MLITSLKATRALRILAYFQNEGVGFSGLYQVTSAVHNDNEDLEDWRQKVGFYLDYSRIYKDY